MTALISLASVVSGGVVAACAERYPGHVVVLERGAGVLMIAGLALLGASLPLVP